MNWKIYYADGSTVNDNQMSWEMAPLDGVVAVVVRDDTYGKIVLNGRDFYYHVLDGAANDLYSANDLGPQLRKHCRWIKHGVGMPSKQFKEILIKATHDPDFPESQCPMRRMTDK